MNFEYTALIIIIPFLSFLITGLSALRIKPIIAGLIGTTGLGIGFILSWYTAIQYFFLDASCKVDGVYQKIYAFNEVWLNMTDKLHIDMGILIDPISVMMLVVVTTVSFMVHIYSIGYMKGDEGFPRFFAFLSLFTFSMLGLVVATNIFQMYIFWELVGLSSYLLIGYYYQKPSAVAASKKAFITTRFADLGFLVGILTLSYYTGTFDFNTMTSPEGIESMKAIGATFMGASVFTWALVMIFMGGAGKSAMFPLHIWLPDAMEGPTPVSALIHAATMVVAGVYLVARLFPVYALVAPEALEVVAYVGAFSSLFAAIIACTQFDIKRVLAFSTMSQIGYMMLALGVSGYGDHEGVGYMSSMFHLFTHAMFKALLFLGAGSIIHAVHSNDMRDTGFLRKYMPITHITFLIACLAIAGIPPFAGFWSKDEILVAAFEHNKLIYFSSSLVAGLTAFYMFRLYFTMFWGKNTIYHHAPHESPASMTIPLLFLSVMAAVAGFIPFSSLVTTDGEAFHAVFHWSIAVPSVIIAAIGIGIAALFYKKPSDTPDKISVALGGFYKVVYRKFLIDELYLFVTKKILFNIVSRSIAWFDRHVIDASMDGLSWITNTVSVNIKGLQSGQLQKYGFVFVSGVIGLVLLFVYIYQ